MASTLIEPGAFSGVVFNTLHHFIELLMNLEELKAEALRLAPQDRAKLAHALLESLEHLSETEIESLWVDVALLRDTEVDSRRVPLRRADDVLKEAKSRLR